MNKNKNHSAPKYRSAHALPDGRTILVYMDGRKETIGKFPYLKEDNVKKWEMQ